MCQFMPSPVPGVLFTIFEQETTILNLDDNYAFWLKLVKVKILNQSLQYDS